MSIESLPREYRMMPRQRAIASTAVALLVFPLALGMLAAGDAMPGLVRLLGVGLGVALYGWLSFAIRRSGTFVDVEGIRVRGVLRRRRLRWEEIHEIRTERYFDATPPVGPPRTLTYAIRRNGRRVQLLHLDAYQPAYRREVELVRGAWTQLRGRD
jgi:hypothetical protein